MTQKADTLQNSTKTEKPFKPTRGVLRWLEKSFELGYSASISKIAERSGLNRDNWYQWLNKDGFVEWWDSQWHKELIISRWKLDAIGLKKAEKSYRFWKDMMNRVGNTIPEAGNVGQQINTQFHISDDVMERISS